MAKDEKQAGTVKFYATMKNFGFISGDDGKDYFVHGPTGIKGHDQGKIIKEGDRVSFKMVMGEKGLPAEEVAVVTGEVTAVAEEVTKEVEVVAEKPKTAKPKKAKPKTAKPKKTKKEK
jgi:CspA family cold shock protein